MDTSSTNFVNFLQRISPTFLVGAQPNFAWFGVLVGTKSQGILVNFGPVFCDRYTMWRLVSIFTDALVLVYSLICLPAGLMIKLWRNFWKW